MDYFYDNLDKVFEKIIKKAVKPDMEVRCVTDLNESELDHLIEKGIDGVIIDVDETLRFNSGDIPLENDMWLDMLVSKMDVIALSDGYDKKIKDNLKEKGIDYLGFGLKPFRLNFLRACFKLKKSPMKVAVIGDDLWADIHGGNKNNMMTIKVSEEKKR
ncbi:MAG: HAD hydrolase-like protein [Bacilli bacterium]|nr:HAD hydrolase-like protein [Bacilli bacterium]